MAAGPGTSPLNFLVSSAGRRGELVELLRETIRVLDRRGQVFCVDRSPWSAAGQLADGLDLVPSVTDPGFVPALEAVCRSRGVTHVIPTIDTELPVLAEHRSRFLEQGIDIWVSDPETIAIARDKRRTHAWLVENDFPAPRQLELEDAIREARSGRLAFPVIAKPAAGSSSIGLVRVEEAAGLAALDPALDHVVEQIAAGEEHTIDVWVDRHGRCRAAVPRRRLETRAGEVSKGVTVRHEGLIDLARRVAEALPGARGVLNLQVFLDPDGRMQVIEVNARFGGGFPLSWAAGARFPAWIVQDLEDAGPADDPDAWAANLLMLRYDQGVYLPFTGT